MTKKVITAAAFLAASTMLANAASVLYTFNLGESSISEATVNISINDGRGSYTQSMDDLKENANFNMGTGSFWKMDDGKNPFSSSISTLAGNSFAKEILTTGTGLQGDSISKLIQGVHNGNANTTTTFAVTGLDTNTDYTVTLLVGGNTSDGSGGKISWDGATFNGGEYAYGGSAKTTIGKDSTELQLDNLSAVQLKFTTGADSGSFNIKLYNSTQKTGIGLLAISTIPEPSAFGLLAGLGAIALAVSRRRRRK